MTMLLTRLLLGTFKGGERVGGNVKAYKKGLFCCCSLPKETLPMDSFQVRCLHQTNEYHGVEILIGSEGNEGTKGTKGVVLMRFGFSL